MTARFVLNEAPAALGRHFSVCINDNHPPRYNIAPTQPILVVRGGGNGCQYVGLVRWGFVPAWDRDGTWFAKSVTRIRVETAHERQSFQGAWRRRRCLIPMNGFYTWHKQGRCSQPIFFATKHAAPLFAVAGLWEHWMGRDGSEMETAAVMTRPADTNTAQKVRMPLIINKPDYHKWLFTDECEAEKLYAFFNEPSKPLVSWKVSADVNDWRAQGEGLIAPI